MFAVKVGTGNLHLHLVAEHVLVAVPASYEAIVLLVQVVIVVGEVAHRHESFALVFVQLNVEAPFSNA